MNAASIIREYLVKNGFDGLHNGGICGCDLDDLIPCEESIADCRPGYKVYQYEGDKRHYLWWICESRNSKPWEDDD